MIINSKLIDGLLPMLVYIQSWETKLYIICHLTEKSYVLSLKNHSSLFGLITIILMNTWKDPLMRVY